MGTSAIGALFLFLCHASAGNSVRLAWDPNSEPDLAGYRIYYGTKSGQWDMMIDVGNVTTTIVSGLTPGTTYYFVATAYNTLNLESDPSNEVSYTVPEPSPNSPPRPGKDALGTASGVPAASPIVKLLANDSDPDNDPLTISGADQTSTQGGTVAIDGENVVYSPPAGFSGADQFYYTVSDGKGGTARGVVTVSVAPDDRVVQYDVQVIATAGSTVVRFFGIPGLPYIIQCADAVTGPWRDLSPPIAAGPTGLVEYLDTTSPKPPVRFYRRLAAP